MDRDRPYTVACIPAWDEESNIAKVICSAKKYVDKVLVCDDGSLDMTAEIARELGAIVVSHDRNMGKGEALKTLFDEAMKLDADILVLLDGDGQHDPCEIPKLIEPIVESKADLVVGSRYVEGASMDAPLYRRVGLKAINALRRRVNRIPVSDAECGFRAFSRKALAAVSMFETNGYAAEAEMLALATRNGIQIAEAPVRIRYRGLNKTSKKAPLAHGGELMKSIVQMMIEERPLLYLGVPGIVLLFFGFLLTAYQAMIFNVTQYFSIHVMIVIFGVATVGFTFIVASLILYALKMLKDRIADLKKP